jgi:hypothetical protein
MSSAAGAGQVCARSRTQVTTMTRVLLDISMSLDGFVAGPRPTLKDPLGEGGERLHEWVVKLATWRGDGAPDRRRDHGPAHVQRR